MVDNVSVWENPYIASEVTPRYDKCNHYSGVVNKQQGLIRDRVGQILKVA